MILAANDYFPKCQRSSSLRSLPSELTSRGTGGRCRSRPACVCARPACCCRSAPLRCLRSRGSVRNAASPRSRTPPAPTRPDGGTRSCLGCRSGAGSRTCRPRSAGWLGEEMVASRSDPMEHKAPCADGCS